MLRKLVGYAAYMFGANVFTALLTFAVTAFGMASRSKEAFGDYITYMLVYEIGTGVLINGVNATIQRYSAESEDNRQRFTKLVFLAFFAMLAVFGLMGTAAWTFYGLNLGLGFFGIPWVVVGWYGRYIVRSSLDARREARLMVIASLSSSVFRFLFLTFTDLRDAMIYGDFLALVVSGLAAVIILPSAIDKPLKEILATKVPKELLVEAYHFSVPLWWAGLVFTVKARLQASWTRGRLGVNAMGALGGLQLFGMLLEKPMEFLGQASLPGLVSAKEDRDVLYRELLRFSMVALTAIGIAVSAGIPLVFDVIDLIEGLFSNPETPFSAKYAEVPLLLLLAAVAMPARAVEMVTNQYSVSVNRQKAVLYAQLVQVAVMVATLIPLAEAYGLYGVVFAGIIGEMSNAGTFIVLLYKVRRGSMRSALGWGLVATAACTAVLVPSFVYRDWDYQWVLSFPAILVFAVIMFAARMLYVSDFDRMLRAFRGRGG